MLSECVECVGCSNNTIRAGLTRKFVDRDSLVEVLNYRMTDPRAYLVPAEPLRDFPHVLQYTPDCKDFTLQEVRMAGQQQQQQASSSVALLPPLDCGSILVIVSGAAECREQGAAGRYAQRGDIFYIPPMAHVSLTQAGAHELLAYRTFSYEAGPDHWNRIQAQKPFADVQQLKHKLRAGLEQQQPGQAEASKGMFDVSVEMDGFL